MEEFPKQPMEKGPMTDEQCLEAMKAKSFEAVGVWLGEQEAKCDSLGHEARLDLTIRLASMQLEAGFPDYARNGLESLAVEGATMTEEQEDKVRQLLAKLG